MSHSFTPGPWHNFGRQPSVAGLPHSAVGAKTLLARVYSEAYGDDAQETANARLIAAAPDLLEALQWYEAKAVQMGRAAIHQDSKLMLALMKEIAVEYGAQARAAIAKATGEQP